MFNTNTKFWPFSSRKAGGLTSENIGWIFLITNIFAVSTYTIFAKVVMGQLSPLALLFVSELMTMMFILFSFGLVPTLKKLLHVQKKHWAPMITIGLVNGILGPILWFSGLQHSSATNAVLLGNAENMFLAILAVLVLREAWTMRHLVSVSVIIGGILIISLEGFTAGFQVHAGDLLLLLGCINFATGSILFRKYLHGTDIELAMLMRSAVPVVTFLVLMPFLHFSIPKEIASLSGNAIFALLGFALISRFFNTFTFYEAIDRLAVSTVSLVVNLSVVVAVLIAHFGLGEALEGYHILGGALIVAGIVLLEVTGIHKSEAHLETHLTERMTSRV